MTHQDLLQKYDPLNAEMLSEEDVAKMQNMSDEDIIALANAYPNKATGNAYLVLLDRNLKPNQQLYPLSTWNNLRNVRQFSGMKNLVPFTFKVLLELNQSQAQPSPIPIRRSIDLSDHEVQEELSKMNMGVKMVDLDQDLESVLNDAENLAKEANAKIKAKAAPKKTK